MGETYILHEKSCSLFSFFWHSSRKHHYLLFSLSFFEDLLDFISIFVILNTHFMSMKKRAFENRNCKKKNENGKRKKEKGKN